MPTYLLLVFRSSFSPLPFREGEGEDQEGEGEGPEGEAEGAGARKSAKKGIKEEDASKEGRGHRGSEEGIGSGKEEKGRDGKECRGRGTVPLLRLLLY